jgi:alpha-mannosidase
MPDMPAVTLRRRIFSERAALDRIEAQIHFAEGLAAFPDDLPADPLALAVAARTAAAGPLAAGDTAGAVAAAEAVLLPLAPAAKRHSVYTVGHAHIDMNWLWAWSETVAATCDTVRTVLTLMDEFPAFTFVQSQAAIYQILERFEPALLDRVRQRIADRRWEVVASHWVEGEHNIVGGEAMCRQLLETRNYLSRLLGLKPEDAAVDWAPDTFGHASTMPMINAGGGVRYQYSCRLGTDCTPVFWWKGGDGSRVLVLREIAWYQQAWYTRLSPSLAQGIVTHSLDFRKQTGMRDWLAVHGVGDHGGGPTRRDLRALADLATWPVFPRIVSGRVADFFGILAAEGNRWSEFAGECNSEFAGCWTSQTRIKRGNRQAEAKATAADAADALAGRLIGHPGQRETLSQSWRDVLFGHFHDILPGSGVQATRDWQLALYQKVAAESGQVRQQALRALAARIRTNFVPVDPTVVQLYGKGLGAGVGMMDGELSKVSIVDAGPRPYVVFNPCAFARKTVVAMTYWDGDADDDRPLAERSFRATQADGTVLEPQKIPSTRVEWGHACIDLAVPVELPALGWTTVIIEETPTQHVSVKGASASIIEQFDGRLGRHQNRPDGRLALENDLVIVEVDRMNGGLTILDRTSGEVLAGPGLGRPQIVLERALDMSAWVLGDAMNIQSAILEAIEPMERGPQRVALRMRFRLGLDRVVLTWRLEAGSPRLDLTAEICWLSISDRGQPVPRLELSLPTGFSKASGRYEAPHGVIHRPANDRTVPAVRWAAVDGERAKHAGTVVVVGEGQHAFQLGADGHLRVSLLRATNDPDRFGEIGEHVLRLAVMTTATILDDSACLALALAHEHPPALVATDMHDGPLPASLALMTVDDPLVAIVAVKRAEGDSSEDLIIRLLSSSDQARSVRLRLDPRLGRIASAQATDLLERPIDKLTADEHTVQIPLKPRGLATVRITW